MRARPSAIRAATLKALDMVFPDFNFEVSMHRGANAEAAQFHRPRKRTHWLGAHPGLSPCRARLVAFDRLNVSPDNNRNGLAEGRL